LFITIKNQGDEISQLNDKLEILEKKNEKLNTTLKKIQDKTKTATANNEAAPMTPKRIKKDKVKQ